MANSTLAFKRGQSATTGYRRFADEYQLLVDQARVNGALSDPVIRQRLARYYTKVQLLRINGLRSLSATLSGTKDAGIAALGATNKMFWTEMHQAAMELALDVFGPASMLVETGPAGGSWPGAVRDKRHAGYLVSPMISAFFFGRTRRFGVAPARSSATSSASVCSAFPKNHPDLAPHADQRGGAGAPPQMLTKPFVFVTTATLAISSTSV